MTTLANSVLVTGFPERHLALHLVRELLEDRQLSVHCIVSEGSVERSETFLDALPSDARGRIALWVGDPKALDLGLSGDEFTHLTEQIEVIHHCATVTDPAGTKEEASANVRSTREILEFAECSGRLKRLVCWFSAIVSGNREGFVKEADLSRDEGFRNVVEESLFHTERMVREATGTIPIVVLRPALLVGHAITGSVDDLQGPYLLIRFLLSTPDDFRIPAPSRGAVRISTVPVDYAVRAGLYIAHDPRSVGRTFHVVDPKPVTVQHAFELFAQATGRPLPKEYGALNLATTLMRAPGLQRLTHTTRAFLEHLRTDVIYDDTNARELLHGSSISCPPLEQYVDRMVEEARQAMTAYG